MMSTCDDTRDANSVWERLQDLNWVGLPLAARHLSAVMAVALLDGLYLAAWPRAAAAGLAALGGGLFLGWRHWGFDSIFSESMAVLVLVAVLGVLSAHLGCLFVAGFAAGDFFLAHPDWTYPDGWLDHLWQVRLPLLIEYNLLAALAVGVPLLTKNLLVPLFLAWDDGDRKLSLRERLRIGRTGAKATGRESLRPRFQGRRVFGVALAVLGHSGLTGALVYFWSQSFPVLIRPLYTWRGELPPTSAMQPLQAQGMTLVAFAASASLVRMCLQGWTALRPGPEAQIGRVEERLRAAEPVSPVMVRLFPLGARIVVQAAWGTALLGGMLQGWTDGVGTFALLLLVRAARAGVLPVPLGPWPVVAGRIPLLLRLAAGVALSGLLTQRVLESQILGADAFHPVLILTGVVLLIFFVLDPGLPSTRARKGEADQ